DAALRACPGDRDAVAHQAGVLRAVDDFPLRLRQGVSGGHAGCKGEWNKQVLGLHGGFPSQSRTSGESTLTEPAGPVNATSTIQVETRGFLCGRGIATADQERAPSPCAAGKLCSTSPSSPRNWREGTPSGLTSIMMRGRPCLSARTNAEKSPGCARRTAVGSAGRRLRATLQPALRAPARVAAC